MKLWKALPLVLWLVITEFTTAAENQSLDTGVCSKDCGYELLMGGTRIGHEPTWTYAQAVEHYRWFFHKNANTRSSRAYFNGKPIELDPKAPELWSSFKDLKKSTEACKLQARYMVEQLAIENIAVNEYGIYGTSNGNRVVIKCLEINEASSKLMVAVAGNDSSSVENLRNRLVKAIK